MGTCINRAAGTHELTLTSVMLAYKRRHASARVHSGFECRQIKSLLVPAGPVYKYDFSLPLPQIYDLVEATRSRLAHLPATVVSYGHLGEISA